MARGKWRGGQPTRVRGVKSLGGGSYRIRVTMLDPMTGRRIERERIVEAASVAEAAKVRAELQEGLTAKSRPVLKEPKAEAPKKTSASSPKLGDWARRWLDKTLTRRRRDGSPRVTPRTKERYTYAVERIIVPSIGDHPTDKLTKELVEVWRDWLGEKYASNTVNGWLTILRSILRDSGATTADRVPGLKVDDTQLTDDEPNLLGDEKQVRRFLDVVRDKEPEHYALIAVLLTTGLRVSTALALRREDFDPEAGVIIARRRISGGELIEGVKRSRTARDVVPLVDWVNEAVQADWQEYNEAQRGSGLAFPTRDGKHRARTLLKKPVDNVAKALGLGRLTPHGLRRTAALLYRLRSGSAVSKAIAGHLTEEMHLHYAPVLPAERAAAGRAVFGEVGTRVPPEVGTDVGSKWGQMWGHGQTAALGPGRAL